MKTNELRVEDLMVGDWFLMYRKPKQAFSVSELNSINILVEAGEKIESIPITTEILGKNGFKKDVHNCSVYYDWLNLDGDDVTLRRYPCGYFELHITDNENLRNIRCPIAYVHELQHALKLCGIDKEIEL